METKIQQAGNGQKLRQGFFHDVRLRSNQATRIESRALRNIHLVRSIVIYLEVASGKNVEQVLKQK
jgi:hypothetical protein